MIAVNKVILYPNNTIVPKLQITPMPTTSKLITVALTERKKRNKVITDKIREPVKNQFISFLIRSPMVVRINGSPLVKTFRPVFFSNASTGARISLISLVRFLLLIVSLFTFTPTR